jgi:carbamoyltransferase
MRVLGISGALNHDASVSIVEDSEILFAGHAERYSKIKNDSYLNNELLHNAIMGKKPDVVAWYEKPVLKKMRQLKSGQYDLALSVSELPRAYLRKFPELSGVRIEYQPHHYTHAASGYFTSKFAEAAILVVDSIGEFDTISIWRGEAETISCLHTETYPHSLGLFYSAMTARLGLKAQEDEYILMGMAAYGEKNRKVNGVRIIDHMMNDFGIRLTHDGIHFGENLHRGCRWFMPELTTEQDHFDLAAAAQALYETAFDNLLTVAKRMARSDNLVLMGGAALNCVANSNAAKMFSNIWIMPNPGDSGSCIGVAQKYFDKRINWRGPYLGYDIAGEYPIDQVLTALLNNEICGIASGRAEFGPRALGNRTLTADPRGQAIKDRVNEIKRRQKFRPFAPMILEQHAHEYFDMPVQSSPYMQYIAHCKYPDQFPAIVHVDGSSRVQTVNQEQHPALFELLTRFKDATGCPMLLNTSLNIKGMPIVNDELDAQQFVNHYGISVFTSNK